MGRTIDGKPIFTMACYYVDGLLIDTGPYHVADEIDSAFASFPVQTIVNTHHHEDHIGNNRVFQEKLGLGPALAHPRAVPRILETDYWAPSLLAYQQLAWGTPPPSRAIPIGSKVDTSRYSFQVIDTPGHSDDHITLLEPENGWLFGGDLFIKEELSTLRWDEDVNSMLESLHKLLNYSFETIFCSSGRVVKNAREAVEGKIAYWEAIGERVQQLDAKGIAPEVIREQVLGKESALFIPTEGAFGKINLVLSFLGRQKPILYK